MGSSASVTPEVNIMISIFLIIVGLFLSTAVSVMAYYFKQLKQNILEYRQSIQEYKALVESRIAEYKNSVEARMREGEERFEKLEENISALRSEVYKDYVTKPDLLRIMGSLEFKFKEIMEFMDKAFKSFTTNTTKGEVNK